MRKRNLIIGGIATFIVLGAVGSAMGGSDNTASTTPTIAPAASTAPAVSTAPTTAPVAVVEETPDPEPVAVVEETPDPEPVAAAPVKVSYAKLTNRQWAKVVKSPDNYTGKGYQLWACITQFDAATGTDTFRAQASNKKQEYWFSDGKNVMFDGDAAKLADFVEDDLVFMRVISEGSYSYDTQAGGNTTVPMFEIAGISRKGSCA